MKTLLGLYEARSTHDHHEEGSDPVTRERLLAVDYSETELRRRWNARQKEICLRYGYDEPIFYHFIPPYWPDGGTSLSYPSSSCGGFCTAYFTVQIRPLKQFDDLTGDKNNAKSCA